MKEEVKQKPANNNLQIEDVVLPAENQNSKEKNMPVLPPGPLQITLDENTTVEFNDVVSTEENKVTAIRQYIRSKVLRMFNVSEVSKTKVQNGTLYFNGNRTSMKLPKVKTTDNGAFAESLEQYYERAKPSIKVWLTQSLQNSNITVEQVEAIG